MEIAASYKTFVKILFALTAVTFLWFATFGLLYHMNMMKTGGATNGCLFNGQSEVCTMNFSEHISAWEGMFTSLPRGIGILSLLLSLVLSVVFIAYWKDHLYEFSELIASRWRLYIKRNPQISLFNPLREAFSQGILNPKIYDSAVV